MYLVESEAPAGTGEREHGAKNAMARETRDGGLQRLQLRDRLLANLFVRKQRAEEHPLVRPQHESGLLELGLLTLGNRLLETVEHEPAIDADVLGHIAGDHHS